MGPEKSRVWRTAVEKRRIVEWTLQPGMSVARVAQAEGVNSRQVFQWRRACRQGTLGDPATEPVSPLPVVVAASGEQIRERCIDPKPARTTGGTDSLHQQPFSGHVFVFRGRRVDTIKLLWWDGEGLCLFAKRLERGHFV